MSEYKKAWLGLSVIIAVMGIVGNIEYKDQQRLEALDKKTERIAKFFIKKGIENPVEKAVVIAKHSKYPKIAAAQAVVESRVNPKARGKAGEKGAFQVRERHWSKVADALELQTKQHTAILNDLLSENSGSLRRAIKAYNGVGKAADGYTRLVLRNLKELEEG